MNSPTRLPFDLGKLADVLRTARGFLFAFALFDDVPSRERLVREATLRVAGEVEIVRLRLSPESPSLLDQLNTDAPRRATGSRRSAVRLAYFVDGFEAVSDESRTVLLRSFQLHREALSRAEAPIVFWLTEPNLGDVARRAPDFFSWRLSVFDFRAPERVRPEEYGRAVVQMLDVHSRSLIPPEELRRRVKLFEEILARRRAEPETEAGSREVAGIHLDLGNIHDELNEWDAALEHYQQAREIRERLGDTAGVASTLIGIGNIFNNKGEWDAALEHYQQARAALERLGDTAGVATTLNNIGNIFNKKGEWDAALQHYQQAREIRERLGDTAGVATTLWNIGRVYEKQGRLPDAISLMEQCIELERRLGHPDAEKDAAYLEQLRAKAPQVPSVS
jgi:tetratricopeptide (TPR) repeat protein